MSENKLNQFLMANKGYLPEGKMVYVKEKLSKIEDEKYNLLLDIKFKSPVAGIILSIFLGAIGVDRFYSGDIGLGVGKLLTLGGCGIWWLIDLFLISNKIKEKNFSKLMLLL